MFDSSRIFGLERMFVEWFKDIVQPNMRGVKRGTIRTVMTSYTIADVFLAHLKG